MYLCWICCSWDFKTGNITSYLKIKIYSIVIFVKSLTNHLLNLPVILTLFLYLIINLFSSVPCVPGSTDPPAGSSSSLVCKSGSAPCDPPHWWRRGLWTNACAGQPRRTGLMGTGSARGRWTEWCPRPRVSLTTTPGTSTPESSARSRTWCRPGWRRGKWVRWINLTWCRWTSSTSVIQVCYANRLTANNT